MRHDDRGAPPAQGPQRLGDLRLRPGVEVGGHFVEDEHVRPIEQGARQAEALLLARRQAGPRLRRSDTRGRRGARRPLRAGARDRERSGSRDCRSPARGRSKNVVAHRALDEKRLRADIADARGRVAEVLLGGPAVDLDRPAIGGCMRPSRSARSVLLPAPLGPTTANWLPPGIVVDTSASASRAAPGYAYVTRDTRSDGPTGSVSCRWGRTSSWARRPRREPRRRSRAPRRPLPSRTARRRTTTRGAAGRTG